MSAGVCQTVQAVPQEPVAVSTRAHDLVSGPPRVGAVLASGPTAIHIAIQSDPLSSRTTGRGPGAGTQVLQVVTSDGLAMPSCVLVPRPSDRVCWTVRPGDPVRVGEGRVLLPDRELAAVRQWRPPRVPEGELSRPAHHALADSAGARSDSLLRECARIVAAAALAEDPGMRQHVLALVGAGRGLTPSGDDALCGVLLALRAVGAPRAARDRLARVVLGAADRTTGLSAGLLRDAADGYAVVPVARLVTALVAVPADDVDEALSRVLEIGASSGADLVAGLLGALDAAFSPEAMAGDAVPVSVDPGSAPPLWGSPT